MGLDTLDTDDSSLSSSSSSNRSSSKNTICSSQPSSVPPASAFSIAMSDASHDTTDNETENIPNQIDDDSSLSRFYILNHERSDIMADFILSSDSNSSDVHTKMNNLVTIAQDNTPDNLIPFARTEWGVIGSYTHIAANVFVPDGNRGVPFRVYDANVGLTEGRPIRNTSLAKIATSNSAKKHKSRNPLANVTCNNNQTNTSPTSNSGDGESKKLADGTNDDSFFMYRQEDPRIYKGEGMRKPNAHKTVFHLHFIYIFNFFFTNVCFR